MLSINWEADWIFTKDSNEKIKKSKNVDGMVIWKSNGLLALFALFVSLSISWFSSRRASNECCRRCRTRFFIKMFTLTFCVHAEFCASKNWFLVMFIKLNNTIAFSHFNLSLFLSISFCISLLMFLSVCLSPFLSPSYCPSLWFLLFRSLTKRFMPSSIYCVQFFCDDQFILVIHTALFEIKLSPTAKLKRKILSVEINKNRNQCFI